MKIVRIILILLSMSFAYAQDHVVKPQDTAQKKVGFLRRQYQSFVDDIGRIKRYYFGRKLRYTLNEQEEAQAALARVGIKTGLMVILIKSLSAHQQIVSSINIRQLTPQQRNDFIRAEDKIRKILSNDIVSIDLKDVTTLVLTVSDYNIVAPAGSWMPSTTGKGARYKQPLDKVIETLQRLNNLKITAIEIQRQRRGIERAIPWVETMMKIQIPQKVIVPWKEAMKREVGKEGFFKVVVEEKQP